VDESSAHFQIQTSSLSPGIWEQGDLSILTSHVQQFFLFLESAPKSVLIRRVCLVLAAWAILVRIGLLIVFPDVASGAGVGEASNIGWSLPEKGTASDAHREDVETGPTAHVAPLFPLYLAGLPGLSPNPAFFRILSVSLSALATGLLWAALPLPFIWRFLLALAFVLLMVFVKPVVIGGDAAMYADDIANSLPHGWGETHALWNFAHLIWRPLGRLLAKYFLGVLAPHFGGNARMTIAFLLMLPNLVAALACGLVLQDMVWRFTESGPASFLTAFAFLCLNPLLHYARFGSPYIVGVTCTTVATYFAAVPRVRSWPAALLAGGFAGIAVLCWAPFLVSFPAILVSIWVLGRNEAAGMSRIRFAIFVCAAAGGITIAFYALAMGAAGIHGVSGLVAWIHESASDSQSSKLLRMVSGMVRSTYELGDDSVWLKWYIFRDPYTKVGIVDLVRVLLTKIALFYVALIGLAVLLWHSLFGRHLLLFIAIAMLPHMAVALSYESGSVERYVGFLPPLFLGFGYGMGSAEFTVRRRLIAGLLCCAHIPFNLASASDRNLGNVLKKDPARLQVLLSLAPGSRIFLVNSFDPLFRLGYGDPLNPLHKQRVGSVNAFPAFGRPASLWRSDFACSALSISDRGGEVWVTKRFLSAQPKRSWLWVEGDLPGLTWSAMHEYFSTIDKSVERGGTDGFFQVSTSGESRRRLLMDIESSGGTCDPGRWIVHDR